MSPDGVPVEAVIAAARSMIGKPWVHQARCPSAGVDCLGLMLSTAALVGMDYSYVPRNYGRTPTERLLKTVEELCSPAPEPAPGTMALFKFPSEPFPRHFALIVDWPVGLGLLHADSRRGIVVQHGFKGAWKRWHHSTWLIPGVVYE